MLSIIIPTYNEYANLSLLMPYIAKQLGPTDEMIIVDCDKSDDNCEDLCEEYQASYLRSRKTSRAVQLNEGARMAKNSKLFFLHADVIPPQGFVTKIIKCLGDTSVFGGFSYQFDSPSKLLAINASFTKKEGLFAGGGDQGLFISRGNFERIGGYNEECLFMEDFEFYDRCKKDGMCYNIILDDAIVSSRKYQNHSYLKVNMVQGLVFLKYKMGHSQRSIKSLYDRWLS